MITAVIPTYNLDENRKRNLEFIFERLTEAGIKVVIAIQDKKIDEYYKKFKEAKLVNFFNSNYENKCNKSFIFNCCIKNITFDSDFILFLDADVYLPFKELEKNISEEDEIVQPFFDCFYIDNNQTINFIKEREVEVSPEVKKVYLLGACSLIIKKSVLNKVVFDEDFYSWGLEDVSLGDDARHLKIRTIIQPAIHLYHKKNIEKKIAHVFSCEKNFNKQAIESYVKFSEDKNIKLINCAEENYLNEYNINYVKCTKYSQGYYFSDLIDAGLAEINDDEWLLYTDSEFQISEYVYSDISNCKKNYIEIKGCFLDSLKKYSVPSMLANGFAFRKSFFKSFYYPKIFTKNQNLENSISDYFKNIRKHTIEDQLIKIKHKENNKIEKFYKSNKILYFSPHAPDIYSSGGDRLLKILKILKDLKYEVHFFCNFAKNQECLNKLNDLNIPYYLPNENYLTGFLMKLDKENFNHAIFSWYDMALQYMHIVKQIFPQIKIIVDTVDIHWKREIRGINQNEIPSKELDNILKRKDQEKNIYSNADVIFTVTNDDKEEITKELGSNNNIKILSNIHDVLDDNNKNANDILFIGNYTHTPNISAAESSIKIFKEFIKTEIYKNLKVKPKLYVAGNEMPETIKIKCDNKDIILAGKVKNLDKLYKKIKVSISPLTWGSGIKGKICDAASRGKIILTSDIGNEGINLVDGVSGFIANQEVEFVKKLSEIYSNNSIDLIAQKGKLVVQNLVSVEAAKSVLSHTLKAKPVTIVIVTYNKSKDLKRCLESIIKNTDYPDYKIVVYDNNSTDETDNLIKQIKENFDSIEYIKNYTNDYFVIPNNKIMKDSKYINSDIVLVNNDIEILTKCWLSTLYSTAYSMFNICSVGCKILYPDYTIAEAGAELYKDGTGKNIGRGSERNFSEYCYQRSVGYCSGCLLYMRRDAINKIGVFDEDFAPMYYEESEWQYRAHTFGLKTIYEPKVEVIHHESKFKEMKKHQIINKDKFVNKYFNKNIEQYNK